MGDSSDDDEAPLVFKRSTSSSKKAPHANSNMADRVKLRHSSGPENGNDSKLNSSKNIPERTDAKSPSPRGKQLDNTNDGKLVVSRKVVDKTTATAPAVKDESPNDSDDDNKPLISRLNAPKSASSAGINDKKPKESEQSEDSEDEKPLSAKFLGSSIKSNTSHIAKVLSSSQSKYAASSSNAMKLKAKSPLSNEKPGITIKKEANSVANPQKAAPKRPSEEANNHTNLATKKPKTADGAASMKPKALVAPKREPKREDSDDDDVPLAKRVKKSEASSSKPVKSVQKNISAGKNGSKVVKKKDTKDSQFSKAMKVPPGSGGGQKWTTLEHNGVIFPPPYKPHGIKMLYNGQPVDLTPEQEEVATMFAVMKDTDYAAKPKFVENFFNDWKGVLGKNHVIKKFELCDFTPIYEWHLREKEKKKQMSSEEKKALKEEKLKQEEKYMWAMVDGVKEKVGNFRVEPPGLFRGRGEHPKMGKLKRRIRPSDITINIGKGATIPECPIADERWKEVRHDNTVTWLAYWNDPINQRDFKYVFLAASSSLKGQSDKEKYEKSRKLKDYIHNIRTNYTRDFTSKDPTKRQIAVATYLIDKLALRAGNEKDDDEADTVGCCTLKVENVVCLPPNRLQFDFLGKDSIRYFNTVEVVLPVYKAIEEFRNGKNSNGKKKSGGDDLFDLLDTSKLNATLRELMPGLTAKVFRTYNASITLDDILSRETEDGTVQEKIAVYQRANKEVAIICNHQRSVSKSHESQMSKLNEKIEKLKEERMGLTGKGTPSKRNMSSEVLQKKLAQIDAKIEKMEQDKTMREDLKTVALGTSKINYLDPRITVAWCKRHEVPIEKIFNKSLLAKFSWAMDAGPEFRF